MQIPLVEFLKDPEKFLELSSTEPVFIAKDGKNIAKVTGLNPASVTEFEKLFGILSDDVDLEQSRLERITNV